MYEVSKITEIPPCCYTEEEVERLLAERMQSIADGTADCAVQYEIELPDGEEIIVLKPAR